MYFQLKDKKIISIASIFDSLSLFTQSGMAILQEDNEDKIKEHIKNLVEMGLIKKSLTD